jgi:G:T-mismatch repair DNA endonuclease (very short patch repair protein)
MRGRKHTKETRNAIAATKLRQFQDGAVRLAAINKSKAESRIAQALRDAGIPVETQYRIKGASFIWDFCLPVSKLLIEYNGDYWHCNPERFTSGQYIKFPRARSIFLVDDVWARDRRKQGAAEAHGYKTLIFWESELKRFGIAELIRRIHETGVPLTSTAF